MIVGEKRLKGTVVGEKYPKETIRSDGFFPLFFDFWNPRLKIPHFEEHRRPCIFLVIDITNFLCAALKE